MSLRFFPQPFLLHKVVPIKKLSPSSTYFTSFPSLNNLKTTTKPLLLTLSSHSPREPETTSDSTYDFEFLREDEGEPWEGAVVYRRNASVTHLEYCTSLERLGLQKLSTRLSRSRASAMGIRFTAMRGKNVDAAGGDEKTETPVLVSVDVTRMKGKLKLDGIVRTVITLACRRCGEPTAESIFSNITLLLTEDPIEGLDEINFFIGGKDRPPRTGEQEGDGEEDIDPDDMLHFPREEKQIDISKHIRDTVHVEITLGVKCDASCKGMCLRCGTNLNRSSCNCSKQKVQEKDGGPLKNLRKQVKHS